MAEESRVMYLDDQMLQILARMPQVVREFPFLGAAAGADCCTGDGRNAFQFIRAALLALPDAEKEKFRNLVRAKTVVVFQPGGEAVRF